MKGFDVLYRLSQKGRLLFQDSPIEGAEVFIEIDYFISLLENRTRSRVYTSGLMTCCMPGAIWPGCPWNCLDMEEATDRICWYEPALPGTKITT